MPSSTTQCHWTCPLRQRRRRRCPHRRQPQPPPCRTIHQHRSPDYQRPLLRPTPMATRRPHRALTEQHFRPPAFGREASGWRSDCSGWPVLRRKHPNEQEKDYLGRPVLRTGEVRRQVVGGVVVSGTERGGSWRLDNDNVCVRGWESVQMIVPCSVKLNSGGSSRPLGKRCVLSRSSLKNGWAHACSGVMRALGVYSSSRETSVIASGGVRARNTYCFY